MPESPQRIPTGFVFACLGMFILGFGLRFVVDTMGDSLEDASDGPASSAGEGNAGDPRTLGPYRGYGVWIDAFDFDPAYTNDNPPDLPPEETLDDFAAAGVDTIYLQASRRDDRATSRLLNENLLGEFLVGAHQRGISVVAWYLPRFDSIASDLDRVMAMAEFRAAGHQFDGIALDIEFTGDVPAHDERSRRLVELSRQMAENLGEETVLGAIVLPTVQIEVINDQFWPRFPWAELAPHYDVWLPMAYSTTRTTESGYRNARRYAVESTERMRRHLDDDAAAVHLIGGIGTDMVADDFPRLSRATDDVDAIGVSVYDWDSLTPALRDTMTEAFGDG